MEWKCLNSRGEVVHAHGHARLQPFVLLKGAPTRRHGISACICFNLRVTIGTEACLTAEELSTTSLEMVMTTFDNQANFPEIPVRDIGESSVRALGTLPVRTLGITATFA